MLISLALGTLAHAAELSLDAEKYELDNGLDVILIEDHSTPIVHVNVWYHVASRNEKEGLTGFAHLFEHLMFQGSVSQPGEYFDPLAKVGAAINGSTSQDRTDYWQTVPSEHLPMALFLESDRMGWLLPELTQEKLDNQREVVKNERRQRYEDAPFGTSWMQLGELTFPKGHPYNHTPIGSHEDLTNASLDDVKEFFKTWYIPNNASLAIVGDFDKDTAKKLVEEYFGNIPRGEDAPAWEHAPVDMTASIERRSTEDVPEHRVWMSWPSPALYQTGDAELDLLTFPLANGKDSRLYKALVETGIAKSVNAFQASKVLASNYVVMATAAPGHTTDEIVEIVEREIAAVLGDQPPTQADLDAALANYKASFYARLGTIRSKANMAQSYNLSTGQPDYITEDLGRYSALTPEQVVEASRAVLQGPRAVLHIGPPEPEAGDVSEDQTPPARRTFWQKLFGKKSSDETTEEAK